MFKLRDFTISLAHFEPFFLCVDAIKLKMG